MEAFVLLVVLVVFRFRAMCHMQRYGRFSMSSCWASHGSSEDTFQEVGTRLSPFSVWNTYFASIANLETGKDRSVGATMMLATWSLSSNTQHVMVLMCRVLRSGSGKLRPAHLKLTLMRISRTKSLVACALQQSQLQNRSKTVDNPLN